MAVTPVPDPPGKVRLQVCTTQHAGMTWCETVYKGCDASISEPLHEHFASV